MAAIKNCHGQHTMGHTWATCCCAGVAAPSCCKHTSADISICLLLAVRSVSSLFFRLSNSDVFCSISAVAAALLASNVACSVASWSCSRVCGNTRSLTCGPGTPAVLGVQLGAIARVNVQCVLGPQSQNEQLFAKQSPPSSVGGQAEQVCLQQAQDTP